jgi:primosomal protein N' (replication factor Y)
MIAKGLDFEDVTLVGVINADTMLNIPDFRSSEATYSLIEQVAGRAGRAVLEGRVIVQTYWADASAIRAAAAHDRAIFLRDEVAKRKALRYPPYARLVNILLWGKDGARVSAEAKAVYDSLLAHVQDAGVQGWELLPATPCALSRLRGAFRWHVVVKAPAGSDVACVLAPYARSRKPTTDVRIAIDIDPLSMA